MTTSGVQVRQRARLDQQVFEAYYVETKPTLQGTLRAPSASIGRARELMELNYFHELPTGTSITVLHIDLVTFRVLVEHQGHRLSIPKGCVELLPLTAWDQFCIKFDAFLLRIGW